MKNPTRIITAFILLCWPLAGARAQSPAANASGQSARPSPEVLTLEAATEEFLRRNLALEAARAEVQVAAAERVAARLRPRPSLSISGENIGVSGPTPFNRLYELSGTVTQPLELGNRGGLRAEVAERTVTVAEARLSDVLQRRLFEFRRTFYEAVLQRALLGLAEANLTGFEELVRFNTVRLKEGYISEGELIKVRLERIRFESAVAGSRLALRQANIRLLELLGESDYARAAGLDVRGALEFRPVALNLAELRQLTLEHRPEIKAAQAAASRAEALVRLERSRGKGEIAPFVGYKRVGVDNTVLAGVTIPLPFGNRNQGAVAKAEAEERLAQTNLGLVRNRALAEVESAYRAYETAREQVRTYEAGLLRQADESRGITLAAYREGAAELLSLLDAERTRAEVRTGYYRAVFDYLTSLFQLEQVTGVEMKR